VGFAVFDRLLISVHPRDCYAAKSFIQRFLADASSGLDAANARSRIPTSPVDLVLRMVNAMVDSYLDLRRELTVQLDNWQTELLKPHSRFNNWSALTGIRSQLHTLEDLCEEQHDAMQEWLDTLREQPLVVGSISTLNSISPVISQAEHDALIARARDVIEHIERVVHHVRRLEQSAESAIQIYFGAQGNRTNDIMRTLTALTAIFLPLNLITGFFGMNFETFPLIHDKNALWWTMGVMVLIAITMGVVFWRKRYLARTGR
jgi:Mg2+ and Co2+ transporter CorA